MYKLLKSSWFVVILLFIMAGVMIHVISTDSKNSLPEISNEIKDSSWIGPSLYTDNTLTGTQRKLVIYGEDLIAHTANYLGPQGTIAQISNGMNCQNCHLDAGNRPWGNNYGAVYATYPKYRERSGEVEGIYKRVNDCFNRSLNGKSLDTSSIEMKAIYAYLKWLGQNVTKGKKPSGSGLEKLPYMARAASKENGQMVYTANCQTCHGSAGEGILSVNKNSYLYPPLWGEHSYNDGAGLYRLSNFAGYVKNNMPYGQATHKNPVLSTEEAWDVAAYVNSQSRPHADQENDYPEISKKPIDFPFGPYIDGFSAEQHKYGPFGPIADERNKSKTNNLK